MVSQNVKRNDRGMTVIPNPTEDMRIAIVFYEGKLSDGTVFESNFGKCPLEYELGSNIMMIPLFERTLEQMNPGDEVDLFVPCEKAFGHYSEEQVRSIPVDEFPNAGDLPIGKMIYVPDESGSLIPAKVLKVEEGNVHIDLNHPLVDKDLNFHIRLENIRVASR